MLASKPKPAASARARLRARAACARVSTQQRIHPLKIGSPLFERFKQHISFGYIASAFISALVLAVTFSFGETMRNDGYIDDPIATAWFFLLFLVGFFVVIIALCELIARFNDGRKDHRRRKLRRERDAARRAQEKLERTGKIEPVGAHTDQAVRAASEARDRDAMGAGASASAKAIAHRHWTDKVTPYLSVKSIALFAAIICVLWIPYMVAMFPGSMNWDTFYQISMFQETFPVYQIPWIDTNSIVDAWLSDHHPVFDTLLYGVFAKASLELTGTWHIGVFIFCLIQCYLTAAAFAGAVGYLRRVGAPAPLRFGILVFFAIAPFFPMYGMTMLKDSTQALVFVPYLVVFAEIVRTKGSVLKEHRKVAVWFFVLALLVVLTKKTGLYVIFPTCIVCAIVFRAQWKHFVAQAATVGLLMWVVLPCVVFPLANIVNGGVQEPLNWMFQQTARYVVIEGNEVTDEERAAIDAVIDYDKLASEYVFNDSDTVKAWYRYDTATTQDLLAYIATWAEMGLKHPDIYIQSIICTATPFFNAHGIMGVHGQTGDGVAEEAAQYIWQPSSPGLNTYRTMVFAVYQMLVDAPLIGLLFRVGPYACWIPLLAWCYFARRGDQRALFMLPILLALASCLFTPIFHARYALPIIYAAPFVLGLMFTRGFASLKKGNR